MNRKFLKAGAVVVAMAPIAIVASESVKIPANFLEKAKVDAHLQFDYLNLPDVSKAELGDCYFDPKTDTMHIFSDGKWNKIKKEVEREDIEVICG